VRLNGAKTVSSAHRKACGQMGATHVDAEMVRNNRHEKGPAAGKLPGLDFIRTPDQRQKKS
jgi:hypothetical protein